MDDLEKAKGIFLTDVDPEDYEENWQKITEWERTVRTNEAYLKWREHPVSQEINRLVKDSYKDFSLILCQRRDLTEAQRQSLWAKLDACLFILSLTGKDARSELDSVLKEIRQALSRDITG